MTRWLDGLSGFLNLRKVFGDHLDEILKDAIQLNQKKVRGMKNKMNQRTLFLVRIYFIRILRQKFAKFNVLLN